MEHVWDERQDIDFKMPFRRFGRRYKMMTVMMGQWDCKCDDFGGFEIPGPTDKSTMHGVLGHILLSMENVVVFGLLS